MLFGTVRGSGCFGIFSIEHVTFQSVAIWNGGVIKIVGWIVSELQPLHQAP